MDNRLATGATSFFCGFLHNRLATGAINRLNLRYKPNITARFRFWIGWF